MPAAEGAAVMAEAHAWLAGDMPSWGCRVFPAASVSSCEVLSCLCVCRVASAYDVRQQRCQSTFSGLRRPSPKRSRCTSWPSLPSLGTAPLNPFNILLTPLVAHFAMSSCWPTPAARRLCIAPERCEDHLHTVSDCCCAVLATCFQACMAGCDHNVVPIALLAAAS